MRGVAGLACRLPLQLLLIKQTRCDVGRKKKKLASLSISAIDNQTSWRASKHVLKRSSTR